jgi:VWFA-related protein
MRLLWPRLLIVFAASTVVVGQQPPVPPPGGQQPAAQQQPPVFRAGVRLVRVDLTVTGRDDQPLAGLQAGDFEVTEDGVPQRVEQVEFVKLDGQQATGDDSSLQIRSQSHAEAEAARDDVRVFAIFLDDYHVDKAPDVTMPLRRGLTDFVRRLWPTDLVAVMEPLTTLSALKFTRDQSELLRAVQSFEGRQGELFPVKSPMEEAQWARGNVRRVRAEVTLTALAALTIKLGGLREGRKTILFVSQGPPTYLGFQEGNLQDLMRDIIDAAHRGNVTIYALDPRTLGNDFRLGARDTLFQLTAETGGRAIVNTNDFNVGLGKMLAETSAYYVIGYTPTRAEDDGKFHKIGVKVRRPGVRVLARQGYWAPSTKEMEAAAAAAADVREPSVARALDSATNARATKRLAHVWMGINHGAAGKTALTIAWEPLESSADGRLGGLSAEVFPAAGETALAAVADLPPTVPGRFAPVSTPILLEPGDVRVRFVAKSPGGVILDDWNETVSIPAFDGQPVTLSTPQASKARTFAEWKALQSEADPQPIALWQFRRTDRVSIVLDCRTAGAAPEIDVHVLSREGKELTPLSVPPLKDGRVRFELPVGSFGQGTYLLRVRAKAAGAQAEQVTAFRLVP